MEEGRVGVSVPALRGCAVTRREHTVRQPLGFTAIGKLRRVVENQSILLSLRKPGPGRARTCLGLPFWLAVRWVCSLDLTEHRLPLVSWQAPQVGLGGGRLVVSLGPKEHISLGDWVP